MIFTDRSRFKTYFQCPYEHYLGYQFAGKGIIKKGNSIPLVTGTHAHRAVELILLDVKDNNGELPLSDTVRDIIHKVTEDYYSDVSKWGFAESEANERVDFVLQEQTTLISGLIWAWATHILPDFLQEWEILHVEQEMEKIVSCDCGLSGIGEVADHISRDCNGVVIMTRPDIVARKYVSEILAYHELKTGSKLDEGTYEGDVQFAFGAAGIEGFTGEEVAESYVHGLSKGYRKNVYNPITKQYDLPPEQKSSLCYAYVYGGISSMVPQDISFKYTRKNGYKKTPVWQIEFKGKHEDIPTIEHYISTMSDDELGSHVHIYGPYPYPRQQVDETLQDIEHVTKRNAEVGDYINSLVEEKGFGHEDTQDAMHQYVPKSWACRRYGYQLCAYYPICRKQAGWESPCDLMGYSEREPNHPIEFEV